MELSLEPIRLKSLDNRLSQPLELGRDCVDAVADCREFLDRTIAESDRAFYGINTGFGALCDLRISDSELEQLQYNLVVSHACGTGREIDPGIARLILYLKIASLSKGHSGIHPETLGRLVQLYNMDAIPVIFDSGSLGASGDLAPLAHLSLPLLGLGEIRHKGERKAASSLGLKPLQLKSKDGLALLNGTQFMSAHAAHCVLGAYKLAGLAEKVAALSLEGLLASTDPFHPAIHRVRPHAGQQSVAARMLLLMKGSRLVNSAENSVQDPYCLRCIPQVHGASMDALDYAAAVVETEINAVTDNPNIFPEEGLILSGGNFHGQPLALVLDHLAIAIAELASISERRAYKLLSGRNGLPAFLINEPGLHSGLMIPQYTAAALVSRNKQLCTPASVDTIDSSNGQEDHVSMGANSAVKCLQVLENAWQVLGIELLLAAQAVDFREADKASPVNRAFHSAFREKVRFVSEDRLLHDDIVASADFLRSGGN